MRKSLLLPILLLASLGVLALGFQATPQGSYFYVPRDNHLSYELYQTRVGTIAHSIEPTKDNTFTSTYALIDIKAKDAISILSDLVRACDLPNPTFQSLHYHVQTDTLVYYCAKNSSLLILNQQDQTVKESISLPANVSLPVAKLSTDGDKAVAILLLDTLFNQSPKNSVLLKVDLQTKKLTTQVLFNQNLTSGEAVVAYAAGKNQSYIATNRVQGDNLALVVYSIVLTGNSYQLTQVTTFNSSIDPKIITKLATLGDYVIVNKGTHIHFFDQQGFVQETEVKIKSLTSQANGLSVPAFTAQYDGTLYALKSQKYIRVYSIVNNTLQAQNINMEEVYDFQVAFGNPATPGSDLVFAPDDEDKRFFEIVETKTFQVIYEVDPRYTDIVLSDTTYAVVRPLFNLNDDPEIHIFDLKTNRLAKIIYMYRNHTSNKDQKIISYLGPVIIDTCVLVHTDVVSLKEWSVLDFKKTDPICSGTIVSLRITENGNPEGVFKSDSQYDIISETYGRITFPRTSDIDSINVNFDGQDLALYYYSANQTTNQITASLYGYNPITKNFTRISTNTFDNRPVEDQGFFTSNQSTTFALSDKSFTVLNKLKSVWSQENFPNVYNGLSTFTDDTNTQFTFFGYDNSLLATGLPPILFSSHSLGFVAITGERLTTVNGIATGPDSYALHDDLKPIGVVRFFKTYPATTTTGTKTISI